MNFIIKKNKIKKKIADNKNFINSCFEIIIFTILFQIVFFLLI